MHSVVFSAQPVYSVRIENTSAFTVDPNKGNILSFYAPMFPKAANARIEAAGFVSPIIITSTNPELAIQQIADQISLGTGHLMGKHSNSITDATAKPNYILAANSNWASITLLFVPKGNDMYAVICRYRFERKESSQPPQPDSG